MTELMFTKVPAEYGGIKLDVLEYARLVAEFQNLRPVVVDGIIRQGETLNIIAPAKIGKSWLAMQLAVAVATGKPWLGFDVDAGRVLYIDNELHPETLAHRFARVVRSSWLDDPEVATLDVVSLRGRNLSVLDLPCMLCDVPSGDYALIVLDALYRFIPPGKSENDNGDMLHVYNVLDTLAGQTGAAIAIVHHSSKGSQETKAQTDVGAGAGSISRCADTHLTIRKHETDGLFVLEAVTRSFQSPEPLSIQYEYPLWHPADAPAVLASTKTRGEQKQDSLDREAKEKIRTLISGSNKLSNRQIRTKTDSGMPGYRGHLLQWVTT